MSHCCHQTRFWALNAPAGGAYSAPPDPVAVFEGPLHSRKGEGRGREWRGEKEKEGRGGKGERREGEGWEGREMDPHNFDNRSTPML